MWQLNTLMVFSVLYIGVAQARAEPLLVQPPNDAPYTTQVTVQRTAVQRELPLRQVTAHPEGSHTSATGQSANRSGTARNAHLLSQIF